MYKADKVNSFCDSSGARNKSVQDPAYVRLNAVSFVRSLERLRRNYYPESSSSQGLEASRRAS